MAAQASILVTVTGGDELDTPIDTQVDLDNDDLGDEASYLWSIFDQPPGGTDSLVAPTTKTPNFTPTREGTYRVKLIVTATSGETYSDFVEVGVKQLLSSERIPARGETGWQTAVSSLLRRVDSMAGNSGYAVGVAATADLAPGTVVRAAGLVTIKTGLVGEQELVRFAIAESTAIENTDETLALVVGTPAEDGATPDAYDAGDPNNPDALVRVLLVGAYGPVVTVIDPLELPADLDDLIGEPVVLQDTGLVADFAQPSVTRPIGHIVKLETISGSNHNMWIWFDGSMQNGQSAFRTVDIVESESGGTPGFTRLSRTDAKLYKRPYGADGVATGSSSILVPEFGNGLVQTGETLAAKPDGTKGIVVAADGIGVSLAATPGLEFGSGGDAGKLKLKLDETATGSGLSLGGAGLTTKIKQDLATDASGLYVALQKGRAQLSAGEVTVSGLRVEATSRIHFSRANLPSNPGHLYAPDADRVVHASAGSFKIKSDDALDDGQVDWVIV